MNVSSFYTHDSFLDSSFDVQGRYCTGREVVYLADALLGQQGIIALLRDPHIAIDRINRQDRGRVFDAITTCRDGWKEHRISRKAGDLRKPYLGELGPLDP